MNVVEYLLKEHGRADAPALITLSDTYSHRDLSDAVDRTARFLLASGASKGDRILLLADNSFFWVAAYLGSVLAGCVAVPVAPTVAEEEIESILGQAEPRFVFLQAKSAPHILPKLSMRTKVILEEPAATATSGASAVRLFRDALKESPTTPPAFPEISDRTDLAALMFTSGSTGTPRGVMVSHRNIIANTASILEYMGLSKGDRVLTVLPLYYCFGTSLLHTHLRAGGSLVFDHRFIFPDKVLQRMQETQCTGFAGVPSHYQILLRNSSIRMKGFPDLRWVQQAGGHLPVPFVQELRKALPTTKVFVMYGQTEATARLSYLPDELLDQKPGSIGKGIPGVQLEVLDELGQPVKPGQTGEIIARGDNVTLGYWRDSDGTAAVFGEGCLRTGDLATVDAEGYIYVVDRAQDFLKCGGIRVSCKRIEEMLLGFDGLVEAAVIGVADEILGESIKAFVVPRNGDAFTAEEFQRFCGRHFPQHLIPKEVVAVSSLPKNSAGKVLKALLKAQPVCEGVGH
jgi:long-chain acyl-CoA synthetase